MSTDHGRTPDDRDDVARLVRLGGRRRAVPSERFERVRNAAHGEWRAEVERVSRIRRRRLVTALAAAACLVAVVGFIAVQNRPGVPLLAATSVVEAVSGTLEDGDRLLTVGEIVGPGAELRTTDSGRAAIRLDSGHSLRLDFETTVRVIEPNLLALDRGALYIDSGPAPAAGRIDVLTPFGRVREIGTQFELRLAGNALRVRLREGAVIVETEARPHEVRNGTELTVRRDGTSARRSILPHGGEWEWLAGVTPMPALDGRTAREFLDWVARERGWTLAFTDNAVAGSASEIVLGGTVRNLTLGQALDAVLPTCRMAHRVEDGALIISPL